MLFPPRESWAVKKFPSWEQENLSYSSADLSFFVRYCCLASGLFPFEESLNTLKADADCPQKQRVWKRHCGWKYAIWKSRHASSEVHSNLSYQWIRSDELLLWARCWCQSHKNPLQLHCRNRQHSKGILMGLRSQTCLLLRNCFGLLYIHPIEYELHLPAIPLPLNWFPWNAIFVS